MEEQFYLCIDLKSFYASVECVERGLDPLSTNLAVADPERSEKTICLAISPSMKALGVKNRCRVFQIPKDVQYIMAPPRMKLYINYSADIYGIYLKYISKEDIHVYSIDEAFLDVTHYLSMYHMSARELALQVMEDIKSSTGITATAGIGTNLYLAKVALDIMAKHSKDNIGYLNEELYQKILWKHQPLTDFWRIGKGIANRLNRIGIVNMGDITSVDEDLLYRLFGIDAELLIDHAWGRETTTMADVKAYRSKNNSISSGQVLPRDYSFEECRLIVKEMADALCLDMVDKGVVTGSLSLMIGYSNELDLKPASGTASMSVTTNSYRTIIPYVMGLYERIMDKNKPIRRLNLSCNNIVDETCEQYDLFTNPIELEKDRRIQKQNWKSKKGSVKMLLCVGWTYRKLGPPLNVTDRLEVIKVENKRRKMDREIRAKQFMPFDALKGFREAMVEKERIIVPKRDLSDEQKEELERKIRQIKKKDIITVEFFQNREYMRVTGMVTRIDDASRVLEIVNTRIAFADISDLRCDMFQE